MTTTATAFMINLITFDCRHWTSPDASPPPFPSRDLSRRVPMGILLYCLGDSNLWFLSTCHVVYSGNKRGTNHRDSSVDFVYSPSHESGRRCRNTFSLGSPHTTQTILYIGSDTKDLKSIWTLSRHNPVCLMTRLQRAVLPPR